MKTPGRDLSDMLTTTGRARRRRRRRKIHTATPHGWAPLGKAKKEEKEDTYG